jgi:hypothetical protein
VPLLAHEAAAFVQALPETGETGASDEFDFLVSRHHWRSR